MVGTCDVSGSKPNHVSRVGIIWPCTEKNYWGSQKGATENRPRFHNSSSLQSRSFSKYTEAKAHQNSLFSGYHYPTTIAGNSIKKILKSICYNGTHTKKCRIFPFNSSRVVRSGMSFPTWHPPRPGFLYGKDTLQHTLKSSCAHRCV